MLATTESTIVCHNAKWLCLLLHQNNVNAHSRSRSRTLFAPFHLKSEVHSTMGRKKSKLKTRRWNCIANRLTECLDVEPICSMVCCCEQVSSASTSCSDTSAWQKGKSPLALRLENFTQSVQNGFRSKRENERREIECGINSFAVVLNCDESDDYYWLLIADTIQSEP